MAEQQATPATSAGANVGGIYYDVSLEMAQMLRETRTAQVQLGRLETSITEVARAVEAHTRETREQSEAQRRATEARRAAAAAAREQAAAEKAAAAEARKGADAASKASRDATRTAAQVAPQVTDIVTSLGSGQSPFTVLLQQGGQLKDLFGGIGPAFRAVGGYVLGLITPLTALAAAAAAVVSGFFLGRQEAQEIRAALELTGSQSGVTAGQVNALAKQLGDLSGITRGQAAEALIAFVQAGVRGEEQLGRLAEAAIRLEKAGGPAVAETAKAFSDLQKNPLQAALKLNEGVNFLTASIYKQIVALQEQGRTSEAARVAQAAYADAVLSRSKNITENLGLLERAWRGIVGAAKGAWDAMLGVGREETPDEKLADLEKRIATVRERLASGTLANGVKLSPEDLKRNEGLLVSLEKQLAVYQKTEQAAKGTAEAKAKEAEKVAALEAFRQSGEKFLDKQARMEREIAQAREVGLRAGLSQQAIEERIAAIRKSYAEKREKFDSEGYLAGLAVKAAEGLAKVDAEEQAALQRNKALLDKREINAETAARAVTLIEQQAARERTEISEKENLERIAAAQRGYDAEQALARKKADAQKFVSGLAGQTSPQQKIIEEEQEQLAQLEALRAEGLLSEQRYQDGLTFIAEIAAAKRKAIRDKEAEDQAAANILAVSLTERFSSELYSVLEQAGQERTALGKALFAASKALAVANIILNTEEGASKATAMGPFGIPLATYIRATGYASAGIVAGLAVGELAGGRQYGGPTTAGSLYRINETGRPEMFTGANGAQYMLPTQNGSVTPADKVGGGIGGLTIIMQNTGTPQQVVSQAMDAPGVLRIVTADLVRQIDGNEGPVMGALKRSTNLTPKL